MPYKPSEYYFPTYTGQSQSSDDSSIDTDQDLRENGNDTTNLNPRSSNKRKRSEDHTQLERNDSERLSRRESRGDSKPTTINNDRHTANIHNHDSSDEDSLHLMMKPPYKSKNWIKTDGRQKLYFKCKYSNGRSMCISFEDMKIDCPNTTAKYIIVRKIGGQKYKVFPKNGDNFRR